MGTYVWEKGQVRGAALSHKKESDLSNGNIRGGGQARLGLQLRCGSHSGGSHQRVYVALSQQTGGVTCGICRQSVASDILYHCETLALIRPLFFSLTPSHILLAQFTLRPRCKKCDYVSNIDLFANPRLNSSDTSIYMDMVARWRNLLRQASHLGRVRLVLDIHVSKLPKCQ